MEVLLSLYGAGVILGLMGLLALHWTFPLGKGSNWPHIFLLALPGIGLIYAFAALLVLFNKE